VETATYTVLQDYKTDRLNGGGPVVWTEGDTVDLGEDNASWVNRDRPGTLAGPELTAEPGEPLPPISDSAYPADATPLPEPEPEPATTPAAEQVGGKPSRGSGRRKDSVG
jgi:hypothetical protein